jgi:hypothetical protein
MVSNNEESNGWHRQEHSDHAIELRAAQDRDDDQQRMYLDSVAYDARVYYVIFNETQRYEIGYYDGRRAE